MQTVNDAIALSLSHSQAFLDRFTADLSADEFLYRPTAKANCVAWTIGHLVLADRRCLTLLGAGDLPALPHGFEKQFSRDEGCPQAGAFGDVSILMPLFNRHRDRLIEAVRRAELDALNKPLEKPHPRFATIAEMVLFMSAHTAMHAGQITIIRRSLGRPPLI